MVVLSACTSGEPIYTTLTNPPVIIQGDNITSITYNNTWGTINGTLADQTDLQNQLAAMNSTIATKGTGTSNVTLPISQGNITGLVQALTNITTNASQNYTVIVNNSGNITVLQGNVTSLQAAINNLSGNLSANYTAWTANDTYLLDRINSINGTLPDMTGNAGKVLTNNGTVAIWATNTTGGAGNVTGNFTVSQNVSVGNSIFTQALYIVGQLIEPFTAALKSAYDTASNWVTTNGANVLAHLGLSNNPHNVTSTQVLPSQTGLDGYVLTTNGTGVNWQNVTGLQGPPGIPGGITGQLFYLDPTVSSNISGNYTASRTPSSANETTLAVNATGTDDVFLMSFATLALNATSMPAGTAYRYFWAETGAADRLARLRLDVWSVDLNGGDAVLLRSNYSETFATVLPQLLNWTYTDNTSYNVTDRRLVFNLYAARVNGKPEAYIVIYFAGNSRTSFLQTTIDGGVTFANILGNPDDNAALQAYHTSINATISTVNTTATHANRSILDNITEAFTTALKNTYDAVVTWLTDLRKAYVDYIPTLNGTVNTNTQNIADTSGNLSGNYTAWTNNDTSLWNRSSSLNQSILNVSGNLSDHTGNITPHVPAQAGQSGKFLTTNGTHSSWGTPVGSGNVSVWGDIGGTLANQADLAANLSAVSTDSRHDNRSILDLIQEAFTTALKNSYDAVVSWLTDLRKAYVDYIPTLNQSQQNTAGNLSSNWTVLTNHTSNTSNPHSVTAQQVGAAPTAGNSSIVTVGNITSGIWSGTAILQSFVQNLVQDLANLSGNISLKANATFAGITTALGYVPANTTTWTGNTTINTLGTITTGTWTASPISTNYLAAFSSANITNALGFTPLGANFTAVTSANITNALGYTPLNTANVSTTPAAGKVLAADANKRLDSGISRGVTIKLFADNQTNETGTGKFYFTVPTAFNGMDLIAAHAAVSTVSSSGLVTVGIYSMNKSASVLSTNITIDANETTSYTAATAPVINTAQDDVATGHQYRIDVWGIGTGSKGLEIILQFALP